MSQRKYRRRYLVNLKFQGWFTGAFFFIVAVGAIAAALATSLAAQRALDAAMFRAHFSEQTTGEILLPLLLKTNLSIGIVVVACEALLALLLFRRAAYAIDSVCVRLQGWLNELFEPGGESPASRPGGFPPGGTWVAPLEDALSRASDELHLSYDSLSNKALAATNALARADRLLHEDAPDGEVEAKLDTLSELFSAMEVELGKYET